jgi:UDP-perosamine 4-acetyltransferase
MSKPLLIVGAGGHGRVVAEAAQLSGVRIAGFIDSEANRLPSELDSIQVLGDDSLLPTLDSSTYSFTIGVGMPRISEHRATIFLKMLNLGFTPQSIFHPSAVISPSADVRPGAQIMANAVVQAGAIIGQGVIINTGAVIEHDCSIDEFCHIAPCAVVLGGATLEAGSMVGANAVIRPGAYLGPVSMLGAAQVSSL